jgi:hypothetical protein
MHSSDWKNKEKTRYNYYLVLYILKKLEKIQVTNT